MAFFEIQRSSEGLFKDRGSKFLAFAFFVTSQEEITQNLLALRKKYFDARHHCYAYRLGKEAQISFADDDGEPAHSAGTPILNTIRSKELTNILIVVIRYFGGTLLGVRGLIDAYKNACEDALSQNVWAEIIPIYKFKITFPYEKTSEVNRILHRYQPVIINADYTDICVQMLQVKAELGSKVKADLIASLIEVDDLVEE
jgi:uncharacterized YigZ family protein